MVAKAASGWLAAVRMEAGESPPVVALWAAVAADAAVSMGSILTRHESCREEDWAAGGRCWPCCSRAAAAPKSVLDPFLTVVMVAGASGRATTSIRSSLAVGAARAASRRRWLAPAAAAQCEWASGGLKFREETAWLWLALLSAEHMEPEVLLPTELRLWWPTDIFRGMGSPELDAAAALEASTIVDEDDGSSPAAAFLEDVAAAGGPKSDDVTCMASHGSAAALGGILSQGCRRISSSLSRWSGGTCRHCLIRSWHSTDSLTLKRVSARQICSSRSKGMSPQTMS